MPARLLGGLNQHDRGYGPLFPVRRGVHHGSLQHERAAPSAVQGQYLGDPKQICNDGVDNDLSSPAQTDAADGGCTAWFYNLDPDADGYLAAAETHVGTSVNDACGNNGWPSDLFSAGASMNLISVQDMGSFVAPVPRLGTSPGDTFYDVRWDLDPGPNFPFVGHITIADIGTIITGTQGYPPMLGGAAAFGNPGPVCPWPP